MLKQGRTYKASQKNYKAQYHLPLKIQNFIHALSPFPFSGILSSKQFAKPAPLLLRLLALLILPSLASTKLLLDCPRVEGLGRCR
ncbi:hypothetical protein, partial [Streptomyces galilaeus]|uniref:hypothetical protein n=1 Tax=Streptomyces galilaeus TaxID=33899 RepID=UPI0038F731FC